MALAMVLAYNRTSAQVYVLQMIFGFTYSPFILWLKFSRRILLTVLENDPNAANRLPSAEEVQVYKQAVNNSYDLLENVYCAGDGLKLPVQAPGNTIEQRNMYNGWLHGHYVGNVFVFAPDGTVLACSLNHDGSQHDSECALMGKLYDKLEAVHAETGGICVMDKAFAQSNYIIKTVKNIHLLPPEEREKAKQATSLRQLAEWGMRAFQGSFPRMRSIWPHEPKVERRIKLKVMVMLYNYRARTRSKPDQISLHAPS
jgi:hypothetical protein